MAWLSPYAATGRAVAVPDPAPPRPRLRFGVLAGVGLGLAALLVGQYFDGGHATTLLNGAALIVVLGGTAGAVLIQSATDDLRRAGELLGWLVQPPAAAHSELTDKLTAWSRLARREGLLALEDALEAEPDPYLQSGLNLLVDGNEASTIRDALEVELIRREQRDLRAAEVFASAGGYCPTIGIVAAVLALIQVMSNLQEPDKLGAGIAAAFVATLYGVGFANLILLPVANRLRALIAQVANTRELVIEGIVGIAHGENPRIIRTRLASFAD